MIEIPAGTLQRFIEMHDNNFLLDSVNEKNKEIILLHCGRVLQDSPQDDLLDSMRCVRILTRDDKCLDRLTSDDFLKPLFSYAFGTWVSEVEPLTIESLKALSNLILKRPTVLNSLRSFGIIERLLARLKLHISEKSWNDILLLDLKVLFLISGLNSSIREELAKNSDAFSLLGTLLSLLLNEPFSPTTCSMMSEALKITYNIGYAMQRSGSEIKLQVSQFNQFCLLSRNLLTRLRISDDDQRYLIWQIVNFLNVVPRRSFCHLLFDHKPSSNGTSNGVNEQTSAVQGLIDYLSYQLDACTQPRTATNKTQRSSPPVLDEILCPIVNALLRGSQGNRTIRKYCRSKILPYLGTEVKQLPEEGNTLRNRLCKLLTNPQQNVSELVALFLFVLCKEDIGRAIKYTGFGNFAGFLARHALLAAASKKKSRKPHKPSDSTVSSTADEEFASSSAEEYSSTSSVSDTEDYERLKDNVNPVTGRWEAERPNPLEGMSEEQKEYITMDLVQKIDQLQRGGLIQPGTVGDDGTVRPVEHVLELLENCHMDETQEESD